MRILLINSEYPPVGGGASNASANIAYIWALEGHDITVVTSRFQSLPTQAVENGVQVVRIPAKRKLLDRSGPFEQFIFMLTSIWYAWSLVQNWKPDVCIAFFGVPSGPAALFLKWLYGIPYIVSLRGSDVPGFRSYDFAFYHRLLSPIIKLVWRNAAEVVANSSGLRDLASVFNPLTAIRVIPNGVDSDHFYVPARQWNPPILLTVGRLVYQKGIEVLFNGLADVKDLDWRLVVVGDGKDRAHLEKLTAKFRIQERVIFTGWQSRDMLLEYYRDANLYVHPSYDEGMSNAILEAMACGLPVLATGVAGSMEVIIDGETGRLIPPGNYRALGNTLRQIIPDSRMRQEMGKAGRKRVVQDYTWFQTGQAYLNLLDQIC